MQKARILLRKSSAHAFMLYRALKEARRPGVPPRVSIKVLSDPAECVADVIFACDMNSTIKAPEHLLQHHIHEARVMVFEYHYPLDELSDVLSKTTLDEYVDGLLELVRRCRSAEGEKNRPIVFIAHGLGGVACEHIFINKCNEEFQQNIRNMVHGIIFLDTPHYRAGLPEWAVLVARSSGFAKQIIPSMWTPRCDPTSISDMQRKFQERFEYTCKDRIFYCFSHVERMKPSRMIAPKWTGLRFCASLSIHSDHFGMAKLDTLDNEDITKIAREVSRWLNEVADVAYDSAQHSIPAVASSREQPVQL
ncbi:hypothetical protein F5884DRAFT_778046 [Xylogone sp. PMI_703]|nr:hypothetical protein F5884DRAFT_778046 [Xylogone sp. PMI_703]